MSLRTGVPLAPRQRLARGLKYTAVGPVDVTRGVLGLGVDSAQSTTASLRRQYRRSRLRKELAAAQDGIAAELAAAQEVVANLPQTLQEVRNPRRKRHPLAFAAAAAGVLAVGAVAFSILRRREPEPSPLPPSVEVTPKP